MKIITGKHKGKNIHSRKDNTLRPTSGLVRGVIFNLLEHGRFRKNPDFIDVTSNGLIEGVNIVDTFCGTGAMGLEALSRGARHVTFIDQNQRAIDLVRDNIKHMGEDRRASYICSDSARLPKAMNPCLLAFVDPPYNQKLAEPAIKTLKSGGWLDKGAIVVLEQEKEAELKPIEGFNLLDERTHGHTKITLLQYIQ